MTADIAAMSVIHVVWYFVVALVTFQLIVSKYWSDLLWRQHSIRTDDIACAVANEERYARLS